MIGLLVGGYRSRVSRLEARERELEAQLRLLFDNSPVSIALATYKGQILTTNKALLHLLRITEKELLQQDITNFYVNPAHRKTILAELQKSGTVQKFGIQLVRNDGEFFYGSVNMSQLVWEGNEVLLVLVEDVTDEIMAASLELIDRCPCEHGCPSCVGSPIPPFSQLDPDVTVDGRVRFIWTAA